MTSSVETTRLQHLKEILVIIKETPAVLLLTMIILVTVGVLGGIYVSGKYDIYDPIFADPDHQIKSLNYNKMIDFKEHVESSEKAWLLYNANPTSLSFKHNAIKLNELAQGRYLTIDFNHLDTGSLIYARYHAIFVNASCADIGDSKVCTESALSNIDFVEQQSNDINLPSETKDWLNSTVLKHEIKKLKARVMAINFRINPDSPLAKAMAVDALKALGSKEYLQFLSADQDRLLWPVYKVAF